jgi:hypothetical protein
MAKTRIIGLIAVGVWLGLSTANPAAAADGLARFEKSIKPQIPPDTLTYKSSKALGDDGFVLQDVVITPPPDPGKNDKPQPIKVKTITVENLDFDAVEKQQPPLHAKIRIEGITTGANAGGFNLKELAGIDSVSADFALDYQLDTDKKVFTLSKLELNLKGLGRIELGAVLDGIGLDAVAQPGTGLDNGSLHSGSLVYDDHSLLAKALPIAAAIQGSDPAAWIQMAIVVLDSGRAGQGPAAQKAIDSLVAFLEDYQKPKGPLKIAINPPSDVSNADLGNSKSADDLVKLLGLDVSYPGKRTSTPAVIPAPTPDTKPDKK